ncbi:MAG: GIY-YIG nuclease family protein [Ignavibacteria bacterium]
MKKTFSVYILATKKNGTLYIGVTNDLSRRMTEHKNKLVRGFTEKYNIHKLVYYETSHYINNAIQREKQLKGWLRKKKIELIESSNPDWTDLSTDWDFSGMDSSLRSE